MPKFIKSTGKQNGFTLIELLVVVSILAVISFIAVSGFGDYEEEAQNQLVHVEMNNIVKAIHRFKSDTGYYPKEGRFAAADTNATNANDVLSDLGFLFETPTSSGSEIAPWDANIGIGWNGPYLSRDSAQRRHVLVGGAGECAAAALTIGQSVFAVEDTFANSMSYTDAMSCFAIHDNGQWVSKEFAGQPYLYSTGFSNANYPDCNPNTCIILISAGQNGQFENGDSDDIVKIIKVNS